MRFKELDTYKISRKISQKAWEIYEKLNWKDRKEFEELHLKLNRYISIT